jgi:hypothetical protein
MLAASVIGSCLVGQARAEADMDCLDSGRMRIWRTENLPAGLGIRRIEYTHEGDEKTNLSTRLFAYHRGSEIVPAPPLAGKATFAYSPKNPLIRTGYVGSGIAFFLSAFSVDAHGKRIDAPCVRYSQESTFEDVELYSDRAAATPVTRIHFEFSNSR